MTAATVPAIAAEESALVNSVRQITAALRGVASGPLDAALAELKRESEAAADRIAGAREFVAACLQDVMAALTGLASDLSAGASANLPAPEPTPEPIELPDSTIIEDERQWPEAPLPPATPRLVCGCGGLCDSGMPCPMAREPHKDEVDAQWEHYCRQREEVTSAANGPEVGPLVSAAIRAASEPATNGRKRKRR